MRQSTDTILLVRPAAFGYNPDTAGTNKFQQVPDEDKETALQHSAEQEFEHFAARLTAEGVRLLLIDDVADPPKPDAVFPNNWVSFHEDGTVVLYPMQAPSRRLERRMDILEDIKAHFQIERIIDLTAYETEGRFLEGTGSIVFDHLHRTAYACGAPRTDRKIFMELCDKLGYRPVYFSALDESGTEIYHTNVMLAIGAEFAVICAEAITNIDEQNMVSDALTGTGRELVEISRAQMRQFAGNMLTVRGAEGELVVMSASAYTCLGPEQREVLARKGKLIVCAIPTIERIGGGSVRCMMAEVFLAGRVEPLKT